MAERLIRILTFTNVPVAGVVAAAHGINVGGTPTRPDFIAFDVGGFSATATDTTVTVTNNSGDIQTVNVWVELKHSIPREIGAIPLTPSPFVVAGGSGGGGGGSGLFPIVEPVLAPVTHTFNAVTLSINVIDPTLTDPAVGAVAILPAASSVPNGTWIWVKYVPISPASIPYVIARPAGADTIDFVAGDYQVDYETVPGTSGWIFIQLYSDGVSNWVYDGGFGANALPAITKTFRYVADGTETDDFLVPIPAPWGITTYNAVVTSGGTAFGLTFQFVAADSTATDVHVLTSASLTLGDVLILNLVAIP